MTLLETMARELILPARLVQGIVRKASYAYKEYTIPKRTGGWRTIHHPSKELKALQRWLLRNVILKWPIHAAAYAYRDRLGIAEHARAHASSAYLLRMDLHNFFPSIVEADIENFLLRDVEPQSAWDAQDRTLFRNVACRFGQLTIGAPSSPALSNALCYDLDTELAALAEELGATYTRYADDLFFSTRHPNILADVPERVAAALADLECPAALSLNPTKTRHSSKRRRRQVTGLVLGSDGEVHLGRHRKRYIRRQIHRWVDLTDGERKELAGLIAFAMSIDPDFLNALILKYGSARIAAVRDVL